MDILPVLDILEGQVVRGVAGRRTQYRRIISKLTASSDPLIIAQSIREAFGLTRFYLADLDGIMKQRPHLRLYRQLVDDGFELVVDAGIRQHSEALAVAASSKINVVMGLETLRSPEELSLIINSLSDVTFSLDLLSGIPQRPVAANGWSDEPQELAVQLVRAGVTSLIVLDLADVGMSTGVSTDRLCQFIHSTFPDIHLISGGGVRDREDLLRLKRLGVDSVLVASALHDGRLNRDDLVSVG